MESFKPAKLAADISDQEGVVTMLKMLLGPDGGLQEAPVVVRVKDAKVSTAKVQALLTVFQNLRNVHLDI